MIPYGKQEITQADIDAVCQALQSDFITQGPAVRNFEKSIANYCRAGFASACANGTAALHLGCLALNIGPGDLIWTSPNTFVASSNCALYCGADVDFVDICPKTYNLSVEKLEEKLIAAKQLGRLPKLFIPVHFAGQSCNMEKIKILADEYGFFIMEDASHAIGGQYQGNPIGCCDYSDLCVFSFHPVKIITTAEGGLLTTNNKELDKKLKLFRTHGVTRDTDLMAGESHGAWYYQQVALGYNYRITDLQCALGSSQLTRLDSYIEARNKRAKKYINALCDLPLRWQAINSDCLSAYHLFVIEIDAKKTKKTRKEVYDYLREQGIGVNVHYIPVHTQPYYQKLGFKEGDFPNAENYYKQVISLPLYSSLSEKDQNYVVKKLVAFSW